VILALGSCACERSDDVSVAPAGRWLVDATAGSGLDFVHETGARGSYLLPEIMASGVAVFDHDGDGDLDVYFTNGNHNLVAGGEDDAPSNRLYRQDAPGRFVDVTAGSGLGDGGYGMGVAVGDVDNDGDPDVYLTNYGPDRLYTNRGDGTFEDATGGALSNMDGWSSSAVFFDYDRDGWLDLFVARYVRYDPRKGCVDAGGRPDYCQPQVFAAAPGVLLHNRGDGTFEDVSGAAGIRAAAGPGLGVVVEDFNDDGWPDLYVANDGAANHLWINSQDGSFREQALITGSAYNLEGRAEAGMGIVAADFDNDLYPDLFLTHLSGETHTLYRNRGPSQGFDDVTARARLSTASVGDTGFGAVALDLELDGDLDIVVVNGRVTRGRARVEGSVPPPWDEFAEPNRVFLNMGDGIFESGASRVEAFTSPVEISRGLAVGDIDGDGDLDLVVSNAQARAKLYLNEAPRRGRWLLVRAVDPAHGRHAIGARVTLMTGGVGLTRTVSRGGSYLSSSDPWVHFGVVSPAPSRLEVRWPDGGHESFKIAEWDRRITLSRGKGETFQ
jgi:hypothetical protein